MRALQWPVFSSTVTSSTFSIFGDGEKLALPTSLKLNH
jgi:hypothetical protein